MSNIGGRSQGGGGIAGSSPKGGNPKSSTVRGSFSRTEAAGVGSGLSVRKDNDTSGYGPQPNNEVNSITGNANERVKPYPSHNITEKGNKFDIC